MSEPPPRAWRFYIDDMTDAAQKVLSDTHGLDQPGIVASGLHYDATVRNLEIIGEAATHVPDGIRGHLPDIPWRQIIALRNRLIHGGLGIDNDTLWSIVRDDIPAVPESLAKLKESPRQAWSFASPTSSPAAWRV